MAKILCVSSGLTGSLNAFIGIGERLSLYGHNIIFSSSQDVAAKIKPLGIRFVKLPFRNFEPAPPLPEFSGALSKLKKLIYAYKHADDRKKGAVDLINPRQFEQLLLGEKPDLVIIDIEFHESIIKTIALGFPLLLMISKFSVWQRKGLPPLRSYIIPGRGFSGSTLNLERKWLKVKAKRWLRSAKDKFLTAATNRRSILLNLAKKEGVPSRYIGDNLWPGPFLYNEIPVISTNLKEMEFPHHVRPNLIYVGLSICEKREDPPAKTNNEYSLYDVFAKVQETEAKLIVFSMGSMLEGEQKFFRRLINAVKNEKSWIMIISVGKKIEEPKKFDLPSNVFTFSNIPQLQVLSNADCSINHGGTNTINECIYFKVPMLIFPQKRGDLPGNAARVTYHQIGIVRDKKKTDEKEIHRSIEEILSKDRFRQNIAKMHSIHDKYQKGKILEKTVTKFLGNVD